MALFTPETKWNADDQKLLMVMNIEDALVNSFIEWDLDGIYILLRAYRLQTNPKFNGTEQKQITDTLDILSNLLIDYNKSKSEKNRKDFYLMAEELFLEISQRLKESGVYFREGKNASHAILERN